MGIRSRAEDLIDEFKGTPYEPGRYIMTFDFKGKASTRFWENVKRVLIRPGGGRVVLRHMSSSSHRARWPASSRGW